MRDASEGSTSIRFRSRHKCRCWLKTTRQLAAACLYGSPRLTSSALCPSACMCLQPGMFLALADSLSANPKETVNCSKGSSLLVPTVESDDDGSVSRVRACVQVREHAHIPNQCENKTAHRCLRIMAWPQCFQRLWTPGGGLLVMINGGEKPQKAFLGEGPRYSFRASVRLSPLDVREGNGLIYFVPVFAHTSSPSY